MTENSVGRRGSRFDWLRRDFWRKVIALAFALLLYWNVSMRIGEVTDRRISGVRVNLELPEDIVCLDSLPAAEVTVRGSKKTVESVSGGKLRVQAAVAEGEYRSGVPYQLRLIAENVRELPPGVRVTAIEPRDVTLTLDRMVTRKVRPQPTFQGEVAEDFKVHSVHFTPAEVTLTGPESILKSLDRCRTSPIPLGRDVVNSFEFPVTLQPRESVQVSPQRVNASVDVRRNYSERRFLKVPLLLMRSPGIGRGGDLEVTLLDPPYVEVLLGGPPGRLATFPLSGIQCGADVSQLDTPGTYTLSLNCFLNNGGALRVKSLNPEKIRVKVSGKRRK